MWSYARLGWATARRCWFLLLLLFLYQYSVGFVLYKYVKSHVVPLLHRYPGGDLAESASRLFWLEAEFQLTKTDLITPYVWTFALFLLARLIVTPLINGGIYNALTRGDGGHRKAFFQGIRQYAKPFLLLYLLQTLLTFAPLLWAAPRAIELAAASADMTSMAVALLPYAAGWVAYQGLLDLIFMYICFGIVGGHGGWASLAIFLRKALPAIGLSIAIFAVAGAVSLTAAAVSIVWAGFLAVLLHQLYPVVRALLKLWSISSQHHLWSSRQ